jgi:uncharacterized protein YkwD
MVQQEFSISVRLIIYASILALTIAANVAWALPSFALQSGTAISQQSVVQRMNTIRAEQGELGIVIDARLTQSAQAKAEHMLSRQYWAHDAPDGTTPWYFFANADYAYAVAGENLAYGFYTDAEVVTAWYNSPPHRAAMLNAVFEDVGIGIATGDYFGIESTIVVAHFGDPLPDYQSTSSPLSVVQTISVHVDRLVIDIDGAAQKIARVVANGVSSLRSTLAATISDAVHLRFVKF